MKCYWLLLFAVLETSCHRDFPPLSAPLRSPEGSSSYIREVIGKDRSFSVTIQAPADHPLFFENCNGAINWALAKPGTQGNMLAWLVVRQACLSAPIEIKPGETRIFDLAIAINDTSAPAQGQYQLVLLGVFRTWSGAKPLDNPQVSRIRLLSNPVFVGLSVRAH